jgi:hypothetical protein
MHTAAGELIAIHQILGRAVARAAGLVYPDDLPALATEKLKATPP